MINLLSSCVRHKHRFRTHQSWLVATLSMIAMVTAIVADLSTFPSAGTWGTAVLAQSNPESQATQEFTDEEIANYARAALAIETKRQQSYEDIRGILSDESVPEVVCSDTRRINRMKPAEVRQVAVQYCTHAKTMIDDHGLTVSRFNEITRIQQSNPQLQQRIQAELSRIQQSSRN